MKPFPFLVPALFACFAVASRAAGPVDDAAPLPAPPMQGNPWTPPATGLPAVVVGAIMELFNQGMADPRGCEYREVEIAGDIVNDNYKVHAWVLPGIGKTRYAVGWNGRVVPVLSVGGIVDLRKDFPLATLPREIWMNYFIPGGGDESEMLRDKYTVGQSTGPRDKDEQDVEYGGLSQASVLPVKVALLLRLGEAKLAEGVWKACAIHHTDPYLIMAREWLVPWYNYALDAHMAGDRRAALQAFGALLPLKKAVEASAARRKIPFPLAPRPIGEIVKSRTPDVTSKYYLEELQGVPLLLADEERRASEPPHVPVLESGIPARGPERIAALIRDLELEGMTLPKDRPPGQPPVHPVIDALISEGDAAVEPLLQCMEEDTRLTLAYDTRTGERVWFPVNVAAYYALSAILKTADIIPLPAGKNPGELTPDDRKALVKKLRTYWAEHKAATG
jgi:hypothetical protein